jgi:hypothetical protein
MGKEMVEKRMMKGKWEAKWSNKGKISTQSVYEESKKVIYS